MIFWKKTKVVSDLCFFLVFEIPISLKTAANLENDFLKCPKNKGGILLRGDICME